MSFNFHPANAREPFSAKSVRECSDKKAYWDVAPVLGLAGELLQALRSFLLTRLTLFIIHWKTRNNPLLYVQF